MSTEESFSLRVLDTLINAPSSVAGIYADLVYLLGFDAQRTVHCLRQTLETLEKRGCVLARRLDEGTPKAASEDEKIRCWTRYASWLPHATREELAVDEIGLWYSLTEKGRDAWSAWARNVDASAPWQLEEDATNRIVTVIADSEDTAERKLTEWLSRRGCFPAGKKEVASVSGVQLQNGRVLPNGVRLTCAYAEPRSA